MPTKLTLPDSQHGPAFPGIRLLFSCFIATLMHVLAVSVQISNAADMKANHKVEIKSVEVWSDSTDVYRIVDQMPEIVGGLQEIYKHIEYPKQAIERGIEGRVFLRFIVDEKGEVKDPEILKDIGGGCGDAAVQAVKKVKFTPGRQDGNTVKVWYSIPITFKIQS